MFFYKTQCSCTTDAVFSEVHDQRASRERRAVSLRLLSFLYSLSNTMYLDWTDTK